MTLAEKFGLCIFIVSAVVLFSGREISNFYAVVVSFGIGSGWMLFILGGKHED